MKHDKQEVKSKIIQDVVESTDVIESCNTQPIESDNKSDVVMQKNEDKSSVEKIIPVVESKSKFEMNNIILY